MLILIIRLFQYHECKWFNKPKGTGALCYIEVNTFWETLITLLYKDSENVDKET